MTLLIGGPALVYAAAFALVSLLLQMFIPFSRYSPILKLLTLSLFAYVATIMVINVPWLAVLKSIVVPPITWNAKYASVQTSASLRRVRRRKWKRSTPTANENH